MRGTSGETLGIFSLQCNLLLVFQLDLSDAPPAMKIRHVKRGLISVFYGQDNTHTHTWRERERELREECYDNIHIQQRSAWHLQHAYNVVMATRVAATA